MALEKNNNSIEPLSTPHQSSLPVAIIPPTKSELSDSYKSTEKRKKLQKHENIQALLAKQIPNGYSLGAANDYGDCFFDALAQIINNINNTDINTDKYLRMLCHDFYLKNKVLVDEWNRKDYGGIDKGREDYYFVQYTAEECEHNFKGRSPIWGRPLIEGRILCWQLNLEAICVIEVLENLETKQPGLSYHLVNLDTYKSIDEITTQQCIKNPKIPILVVEQNSLHFVPLLSDKPVLEKSVAPLLTENFSLWIKPAK